MLVLRDTAAVLYERRLSVRAYKYYDCVDTQAVSSEMTRAIFPRMLLMGRLYKGRMRGIGWCLPVERSVVLQLQRTSLQQRNCTEPGIYGGETSTLSLSCLLFDYVITNVAVNRGGLCTSRYTVIMREMAPGANFLKNIFLVYFCAPRCHLTDGCHLTHTDAILQLSDFIQGFARHPRCHLSDGFDAE